MSSQHRYNNHKNSLLISAKRDVSDSCLHNTNLNPCSLPKYPVDVELFSLPASRKPTFFGGGGGG